MYIGLTRGHGTPMYIWMCAYMCATYICFSFNVTASLQQLGKENFFYKHSLNICIYIYIYYICSMYIGLTRGHGTPMYIWLCVYMCATYICSILF